VHLRPAATPPATGTALITGRPAVPCLPGPDALAGRRGHQHGCREHGAAGRPSRRWPWPRHRARAGGKRWPAGLPRGFLRGAV